MFAQTVKLYRIDILILNGIINEPSFLKDCLLLYDVS